MTQPKKNYSNETRDTDKSLMDTLAEIGTAVMEGFRGSQRASQDPNKEATRAQKRTSDRDRVDTLREAQSVSGAARSLQGGSGRISDQDAANVRRAAGKAYGGKAKKKMMCGGKAKK